MVNTFLPYSNFKKCAKILDYKRLLKQRVEAYQLIRAIEEKKSSWYRHPACKMWIGYLDALKLYYNIMIDETISRGYKNNMKKYELPPIVKMPWWMNYRHIHYSHRASLLRKNPEYYLKYFNDLPEEYRYKGYVWISKLPTIQQENIKKFLTRKISSNPYKIDDIVSITNYTNVKQQYYIINDVRYSTIQNK